MMTIHDIRRLVEADFQAIGSPRSYSHPEHGIGKEQVYVHGKLMCSVVKFDNGVHFIDECWMGE